MKIPAPPPPIAETLAVIAKVKIELSRIAEKPFFGRKSRYKPDYARQARLLAGREWKNTQIADFLGIQEATLYKWRDAHPAFREALVMARENLEDNIERTLASRALGYTYRDTHITSYQGVVTETKVLRHSPPDVNAAKWWLANRRAAKWSLQADLPEEVKKDETPLTDDEAYLIDSILADCINEQ